MANEPFIDGGSRPDLTVDMNAKVGDMTVRQLSDILGSSALQKAKEGQEKQVVEKQVIEKFQKEHPEKVLVKDHKDTKDTKDHKDGKENKDNKGQQGAQRAEGRQRRQGQQGAQRP